MANLMYRQVLVNSFASSASSGVIGTSVGVSLRNSRLARSRPRALRLDTIWGSSNSSLIARPSAMRSGQNATSMSTPRLATIFSTRAVTPGYTVLRRIRIWPAAKCAAQPCMAFGMADWSGSRFSPTGVPMTTITCSPVPTIAGSVEATRLPAAIARSIAGAAPGSAKGILAEFTHATADSLMSKMPTRRPREAKAMARGRPTCPHPPITTMSRAKGTGRDVSATRPPPVYSEFADISSGHPNGTAAGEPECILATTGYSAAQEVRPRISAVNPAQRFGAGGSIILFFAITVLTILWRTMTNHTGSGKPGRAGFDGWGWHDREGAGRIAGPGATSARPPPRSRTRGRTPPALERVQDLLAIPGQLGLADAAHRAQLGQRGRESGSDLAQGRVVEDHVGRDALLFRGGRTPRPELVEHRLGRRGHGGGFGFRSLSGLGRPGGPLWLPAQHDRALAAEHLSAGRSQHERAIVSLHRQQALGEQLPHHTTPFGVAQLGSDAEHRQGVVAVLADLGRVLAEQDVDDMPRTELLVPLVTEPVYGGQELLRGHGAVPRQRRRQARVAVAARRAVLAEVAQQLHPPASHRLAERQHGVEVDALAAAVRVTSLGGVDQLPLLDDVLKAVAQPGRRREIVPARPAGLLVIAFDGLGQVEMGDEAHVGLVDAHAEGDRGDHDDAVLAEEARLVDAARAGVEPGVVGQCHGPVLFEELGGLLHGGAGQAVDDAGVPVVLGA